MVETGGRCVKLPYLNYAAVTPLQDYLGDLPPKASYKNTIGNLINDKIEGIVFLPEYLDQGINEPLVANFNMLFTVPIVRCPKASQKIVQLSSPYCEHVFQRLSRFFYTVGYDDSEIKDKKYIESLAEYYEAKRG